MTEPLHRQIRAAIEGPIRSGAWPPGHRIPFEHELTRRFGCSRMTVNKALSALAAEGLIARRRRTGSVVAAPARDRAMLDIQDLAEEAHRAGREYRHELLERRIGRAGPAEAARLGLAVGERLLRLLSLHRTDAVPDALEHRVISLGTVPAAEPADFAAMPPGTWLIQQIPWTAAEHAVRAVGADARLAGRLGVARGSACLVLERRTWLGDRLVTEASFTYPGDRHRLVGRFGPSGG